MTREIAEKIAKGITDKIECNTVDIDDWAEFWGFTREEYEEFFDMAIKSLEQEPTTKNNLEVSVEKINKLANFAIEATGQSDSYSQGMCNGIEYMRASLTHTEPNYLDLKAKVTPQLSVPEVTALAEWTEKLTKASEDAYNKGYADGMKEQESRKGHWIKGYTFPDGAYWKCDKCNELIKVKFPMNYCNNCGADMREVEE